MRGLNLIMSYSNEYFEPRPFGKYYLLDRIAVGGMAEIYKAKQYGIGGFEKLLVIKKVLPHLSEDKEFIDMFIDEAKIAVTLSHSNIAQVYELGQIEDNYFIAMEYIEGKNLREILKKCSDGTMKMSTDQVIFIMMEVCKALDYAHRKKNPVTGENLHIIHRDISPQNIMISYEGEVKIVDFGIAKAKGKISRTQVGVLKGKFGYMSPEQAQGLEIDAQSDIFSTGIIFWEMLTNKKLFSGDTDFETLEKVKKDKISPPSEYNNEIPKELDSIAMKVLARDLPKRYKTAAEFQVDLTKYLYSISYDFTSNKLSNFLKGLFKEEIKTEMLDHKLSEENIKTSTIDISVSKSKKSLVKKIITGDEKTSSDDIPSDFVFRDTTHQESPPPLHDSKQKVNLSPLSKWLIMGSLIFGFGLALTFLKDWKQDDTSLQKGHEEGPPEVPDSLKTTDKEATPIVKFGYLSVTTLPDGARVSLREPTKEDFTFIGISPIVDYKLQEGEYSIEVVKDEYKPIVDVLVIKGSEGGEPFKSAKSYTFESIVKYTTLSIVSDPRGAEVYINEVFTGKTTPCEIEDLVQGEEYTIEIKKQNYITSKQTITPDKDKIEVPTKLALRKGTFKINSTPPGATVYLNNSKIGKTPMELPDIVPHKKYSIKLSYEFDRDYYPVEKQYSIANTEVEKTINETLKPKPPEYGYVFFQAKPWANIFIDGKSIDDSTPKKLKVRKGKYTITFKNPSYPDVSVAIDVQKDGTIKVIGNMQNGEIKVR